MNRTRFGKTEIITADDAVCLQDPRIRGAISIRKVHDMAEKARLTLYREIRETLKKEDPKWSREFAAEKLGFSDDKLERIENGRQDPAPQDVLTMAEVYRAPQLCNYYCHNACLIGRKYIPEVTMEDLPTVIIRLLDSLYRVEDIKKPLINITADGVIDDDEIEELVNVQSTLERLSEMTSALNICIEGKILSGEINSELYRATKRSG